MLAAHRYRYPLMVHAPDAGAAGSGLLKDTLTTGVCVMLM